MQLIDSYGRRINYLRLSVTDRCNLRCLYCLPPNGVRQARRNDLLSYEDLYRLASEAVALGVEKVRITGGEPLVRQGIVGFLQRLGGLGLKELVLTTNGVLLRQMAPLLRAAGVHRLNISLDSLQPETFSFITGSNHLHAVMAGIAAAEQAGFPAVKINTVVMRGVNYDEVLDFAALTLRQPCTVRFIEYMPTTNEAHWRSLFVSAAEVLERIGQRYSLSPLPSVDPTSPARTFKIEGAAGEIGVISPVSRHFCAGCNRIRVSASGLLRGCLFGVEEIDLKPYLRGADNRRLGEVLRRMVAAKPVRHGLQQGVPQHKSFAMSQIGG